MSDKSQKDGSKKLVVLLTCLCLVICGLVVGIVIVLNSHPQEQELDIDEIYAQYQEKIDAEDSQEVKATLYEERYYLLVDAMDDTDEDYCMQASDDLGELFVLVDDDNEISDIISAMPSRCIESGEKHKVTAVDESSEGTQ